MPLHSQEAASSEPAHMSIKYNTEVCESNLSVL